MQQQTLTAQLAARKMVPFQYAMVVLLAMVTFIDGFDLAAMSVAVPRLALAWGTQPSALAGALAISILGIGIGSLLFGNLGDWIGRRPIIVVGTLAIGLGSIATGLSRSMEALLLWRFIVGLGLGANVPNIHALVAELVSRQHRSLCMSSLVSAAALGGLAAGVIAPPILRAADWPGVFHLGGGVALALTMVLLLVLPESPLYLARGGPSDRLTRVLKRLQIDPGVTLDPPPAKRFGSPVAIFSRRLAPLTLCLWLLWAMVGFVYYLMANWVPSLLPRAGFPQDVAIRSVSYVYLGGIAGGLIVSWLLDHTDAKARVLCVPLGVAVVNFLLFLVVPPEQLAWQLLLLLAGVALAGVQLVMTPLAAMLYPPTMLSTGIGWASAFSRLGGAAGPLAGGWAMASMLTPQAIMAGLAVPALLCLALAWLYFFLLRRDRAAQASSNAMEVI